MPRQVEAAEPVRGRSPKRHAPPPPPPPAKKLSKRDREVVPKHRIASSESDGSSDDDRWLAPIIKDVIFVYIFGVGITTLI